MENKNQDKTATELLTNVNEPPKDEFFPEIVRSMTFGKWVVDENGDMEYDEYYHIPARRLGENWFGHLSLKKWIDWGTFTPAYLQACTNAGIKKVMVSY